MERGSAGQLLAVNTFVWVTTALYAPFIGAYYAEQGITPFQVGVLTAIGPVVSTLIQPLWAYISDRLGKRRRVLMIVTIGSGLTILTYLLHVSFHAFVAATLLRYFRHLFCLWQMHWLHRRRQDKRQTLQRSVWVEQPAMQLQL